METLKNQKIQIGTAIFVLVATVSFFVTQDRRIQAIESRIKHLDAKTELYAERYDAQVEKQNATELNLVAIETKLANIEAMLTEIRLDLKKH
jgi:hypothetical protein